MQIRPEDLVQTSPSSGTDTKYNLPRMLSMNHKCRQQPTDVNILIEEHPTLTMEDAQTKSKYVCMTY